MLNIILGELSISLVGEHIIAAQVAFGRQAGAALPAALQLSPEGTFIALILAMLVVLGPLSQLLGGLFNPADAAAAWAMGELAPGQALLRAAAQTAGAVVGAKATVSFMPAPWAARGEMLVAAPAPGVDVLGAASCEFLLTFLLSVITFVSQRSSMKAVRLAVPLAATAVALQLGAAYTGPVLNPAAALAWTAVHWGKQNLGVARHVAVFWAAPIAAAVLAKYTDVGMQRSVKATPARHKQD